MHVIVII